jgi:hypothetical protein
MDQLRHFPRVIEKLPAYELTAYTSSRYDKVFKNAYAKVCVSASWRMHFDCPLQDKGLRRNPLEYEFDGDAHSTHADWRSVASAAPLSRTYLSKRSHASAFGGIAAAAFCKSSSNSCTSR